MCIESWILSDAEILIISTRSFCGCGFRRGSKSRSKCRCCRWFLGCCCCTKVFIEDAWKILMNSRKVSNVHIRQFFLRCTGDSHRELVFLSSSDWVVRTESGDALVDRSRYRSFPGLDRKGRSRLLCKPENSCPFLQIHFRLDSDFEDEAVVRGIKRSKREPRIVFVHSWTRWGAAKNISERKD